MLTFGTRLVRSWGIETRNEFGKLLNELGLIGEGAEIGVWRGNFSKILLDNWKGTKLYLVDSWLCLPGYSATDEINGSQKQQDLNYEITLKKMLPYGDRVKIIREQSVVAAKLIPAESLDFVYIDADHEKCAEDLETWFPKVRLGGLVAGHDYANGVIGNINYKVRADVETFVIKHDFPLKITQERELPSWYFIKK